MGGLGGLLGGMAYGYGVQVIRNLNQGVCFWDALSFNIDAGQVALYAVVGTLLGTGLGAGAAGIYPLLVHLGTATTLTTTLSADGDPTNEVKAALQGFGNLSQAARYGIQPANQLKNLISGTGLQVHHLIEQRLASALGQSPSQARQWLSVAVTPEEHQVFTNAWRNAIGYINSSNPLNTGTASVENIWLAAQKIYADYPALLNAAKEILFSP